jgi:hypothetical protein
LETLAEPAFAPLRDRRVNRKAAAARREKGGVRIPEAAFQLGNNEVFASARFTAR